MIPNSIPVCDIVEGCTNPPVDCLGGEVYYCAEHEADAGATYVEWRDSPERAARQHALGQPSYKPATTAGDDYSGYERLYECSICSSLVRHDSRQGHTTWHQRSAQ